MPERRVLQNKQRTKLRPCKLCFWGRTGRAKLTTDSMSMRAITSKLFPELHFFEAKACTPHSKLDVHFLLLASH